MYDISMLKRLVEEHLPDRSLRGIVRTFPATLTLTSLIATTSLATRHLSEPAYYQVLERFGMSYSEVWTRDAWHMLTTTFIQSNPGIGIGMIALLLSGLGLAELQIGTWRTVVTFFTADWLTSIATSLVLGGMVHLGIPPASEGFHLVDAGSSAAGLATLAVGIVMLFPNRLARIALVVLILWNVASLDVLDFGIGMVHLVAVVVGALYAEVIWKRRQPTIGPERSRDAMGRLTDAHA